MMKEYAACSSWGLLQAVLPNALRVVKHCRTKERCTLGAQGSIVATQQTVM